MQRWSCHSRRDQCWCSSSWWPWWWCTSWSCWPGLWVSEGHVFQLASGLPDAQHKNCTSISSLLNKFKCKTSVCKSIGLLEFKIIVGKKVKALSISKRRKKKSCCCLTVSNYFFQEYVSCPSCGRTLFDLQEISAQIREKTSHLPGVSVNSFCHTMVSFFSTNLSTQPTYCIHICPADCYHGLHCQWARRDGWCWFWVRRRRSWKDWPLRWQGNYFFIPLHSRAI